jgi:diguanylate cyclase (GGDEF)-like protein
MGTRLALTLIITLVLVGTAAYLLLSSQLHTNQLQGYSLLNRADAEAMEAASRGSSQPLKGPDQLLRAIGRRAGIEEAILIGPNRLIRASAAGAPVGALDDSENTRRVLREGATISGTESDPGEDETAFEFLAPVEIEGERYALEVAYGSASFDAQLAGLRQTVALLILAAALIALPIAYLVGGRSLLRSHRVALERATRDGLTDLANQRAFQDELEQAVAQAERNGDSLALALLDIDRFKQVNDRLGHHEGDAALKRLANTLRDGRTADRAFRIGGDEFALLLRQTDEAGARTVTQRLSKTLREADIPTSIGVAILRPAQDFKDLRVEADAALYEAKRAGGARAELFSDISEQVKIATSGKREAVARLLEQGRLTTVYQPIWSFDTGLLIGIEALSRPDPAYELSGPEEAFDIAETIARVHELDLLCVDSTLETAPAALPPESLLFLNLAPKTLELDDGSVAWLTDRVEEAGLAPERIVIEVTERIHGRTEEVLRSLAELRSHGFRLALDDAGTGNSGLEMLRRIDADYVKLDRAIVGAAATEPNARAVLMAIATFARQTGAFVIAEGVEDEETMAFLRQIEATDFGSEAIVQGGQGFGLGAPMPPDPSRQPLAPKLRAAARTGPRRGR